MRFLHVVLVLGLLAGAIAKAIYPGPDPGGLLVTLLNGVVGAFLGGIVGRAVFGAGITGLDVRSFMLAIGGAFLLLVIYRMAVRSRPTRTI